MQCQWWCGLVLHMWFFFSFGFWLFKTFNCENLMTYKNWSSITWWAWDRTNIFSDFPNTEFVRKSISSIELNWNYRYRYRKWYMFSILIWIPMVSNGNWIATSQVLSNDPFNFMIIVSGTNKNGLYALKFQKIIIMIL